MCSYNRILGVYACENDATLNGLLKGELGFSGWVMSDWGATHSAADAAMNGLVGFLTENCCGGTSCC